MPKTINYPLLSYDQCIVIAETVYQLGGKTSKSDCAKKMGKQISGHFQNQVGSCVKYGLLCYEKKQLCTTELFRNITTAYTPKSKLEAIQKALLTPELFQKIQQEQYGNDLSLLPKILEKEYEIPSTFSKKLSQIILNNFKLAAFIDSNKKWIPLTTNSDTSQSKQANIANSYEVKITGPSLSTNFTLQDQEDLVILDSILLKIKKKLVS
ncbi:hypothetical protein DID77_04125 [Candidatus Marinamargulisbacteria bacterium SCGC AG-439-L15]|nr:hypothetical protein DID77_04125 [Candidatus Marinamargulisbacteria bacterium SCGC AG-439-L15]